MARTNEDRNLPTAAAGTELALPAADEFEGVAGAGLDTRTADELLTPLLTLLQQNSKATNRGNPETYVEGAQPGMFLNSVTRRVYAEVELIPVEREYTFTEWVPLDPQMGLNGGFRGSHDPTDPVVVRLRAQQGKFKKLRYERADDVTEFVETFTLYALIGEPGFGIDNFEQVAIPFTSIKIGRYKLWYDAAKNIRLRVSDPSGGVRVVQPSIWQHRWRLRSVFEQKWKPNGAWNVLLSLAGERPGVPPAFVSRREPVYELATAFYAALQAGRGRADYATYEQDMVASADHDDLPM